MEMLIVVSIGTLSFAAALGLAAGALDVLFNALANMTPVVVRQDVPPGGAKGAGLGAGPAPARR